MTSLDPRSDPVEAMMGGAGELAVEVARRLTTALRMAAVEAADSRSDSAGVDAQRAAAALDEQERRAAGRLLEDLLVHLAAPCRPVHSFATLPRPESSYTDTVAALLQVSRSNGAWFVLPEPGCSADEAFHRALAVFERWCGVAAPEPLVADPLGSDPLLRGRLSLWHARRAWYAGGVDAARGALEEALGGGRVPTDRRSRDLRQELVAELVSIELDRGRLPEAAAALERAGPLPTLPADAGCNLHALALAVRWLRGTGDLPRLDEAFVRGGLDVPAGWAELLRMRERGGPGAEVLVDAPSPPRAAPRRGRLPERGELGAQAVVCLVLDDEGRLRRVHEDVAPGLQERVEGWARRSRDHPGAPGSGPRCALRGGRTVVQFEGEGDGLRRACIEPEGSAPRAAAAVPVMRGDEAVAVIWLEFDHRLVPSEGTLARIARGAAEHPALRTRAGATVRLAEPQAEGFSAEERAARQDLRTLWRERVDLLGLKTAERRWVAFQRLGVGRGLGPVASGGDGGGRLGAPDGGGVWAIRRVLGAGGHLRYELDPEEDRPVKPSAVKPSEGKPGEGEPGEGKPVAVESGAMDGCSPETRLPETRGSALHPGASAGVAIAVPGSPGTEAVLVIESARRGDSRERDVRRWAALLDAGAPSIQCGGLDLRDRTLGGGGLVLDGLAADERLRLTRIQALASCRSDLVVAGEVGSGRRTLARAVHHARHPRGGRSELVQLAAFGVEEEELLGALRAPAVETVVLSDVQHLDVRGQAALARALQRPIHDRPRVIVTRDDGGGESGPTAPQHPDLLRLLSQVEIHSPPLRTVRHRVPLLARSLARRWERSARPGDPMQWAETPDEVDALLWRQPWPGNVGTLEAVVRRASLRAGGASVGLQDVVLALADVGVELVERLPSRRPAAADVASALWLTRTSSGRLNKTRAAAYCGWDPNTLSARLRDLEIPDLEAAVRVLAGAAP